MNSDNIATRPATPWWFWLVTILFIGWNVIGVSNYLGSVNATMESLTVKEYTAEQAEFMLAMPAYYTAVFALAVWGGLLASLLLLFRSRFAVLVYILGLIMVVLSFILDMVGGSFSILGAPYLIIMVIVVILSFIEVWFAQRMKRRGILR